MLRPLSSNLPYRSRREELRLRQRRKKSVWVQSIVRGRFLAPDQRHRFCPSLSGTFGKPARCARSWQPATRSGSRAARWHRPRRHGEEVRFAPISGGAKWIRTLGPTLGIIVSRSLLSSRPVPLCESGNHHLANGEPKVGIHLPPAASLLRTAIEAISASSVGRDRPVGCRVDFLDVGRGPVVLACPCAD